MTKKQILPVLFVVTSLLVACSPSPAELPSKSALGEVVQVEGGAYIDVTVAELQSMLKEKDFLFVNVHVPFEGNIARTDLSIPYDQIQANLSLLPEDKDAKIVLYCRSDRMSRLAAEELVGLGYTNIWNLDGGFNAWSQAGLPLETGNE